MAAWHREDIATLVERSLAGILKVDVRIRYQPGKYELVVRFMDAESVEDITGDYKRMVNENQVSMHWVEQRVRKHMLRIAKHVVEEVGA